MTFSERVASNPLAAFAACFIWIPIAVWVVSMVGWMVAGDVEPALGVIAIGVAIGMGLVAVDPPHPALAPLLLFAAVLTIVAFPVVRAALNSRALAAIDIEQIERAYEALKDKPENLGARMKLAELLFVRGFPYQAVALAERVVSGLPYNLYRSEHMMVRSWRQSVPPVPKPMACIRCGHVNDAGDLDCKRCGAPYLVDAAKGRWLGATPVRRLLAVWLGLMIAFVGIPAAVVMAPRSPALSVALIVVQAAAAGYALVRSFAGGKA